MEKLRKTIVINAPRQRVWDVMLSDDTYRQWTSAFSPGSYFKGDWSKGSKILFLGPNPDGSGEGGMVSRIRENRPHEYLSIEHLGIVKNGVEDTESAEAKKWAPAYENYTFAEKNGGTELTIDMDIEEKERQNFETMWDDALSRLKELMEK
ncbi:MAG: SRPBCC family protein [Thermoanaerobaculia bacterium]